MLENPCSGISKNLYFGIFWLCLLPHSFKNGLFGNDTLQGIWLFTYYPASQVFVFFSVNLFSLWTRQYITTIILSFLKSMIATARLTQNIQKYFTFRETIIILIFKTFYLLTLSLKTVKGESLWCLFFLLMRDKVVKKSRKGMPVDFQYIQFWISFLNQDLDLPSWFSLTLNSLFSLYFIHLHIAESQSHYTFDS